MSSVESAEAAVQGMDQKELSTFSKWFARHEADSGDRKIEEDLGSGRLDQVFSAAETEYREGLAMEV